MTEPNAAPGVVYDDRYRLEQLLGTGGMGEVWRATHLPLDRAVALKILLPEVALRSGARFRFEREARVASSLRHRHAVQVFDFGESNGQLYLAMELLEGETLRSLVDEYLPALAPPRIVSIVVPVAECLIAAHALGMVHRDLKPENIFLEHKDGEERPVVVDFGLAFIAGEAGKDRMTREGIAVGTPDYLSPEQAAGEGVGVETDVYALGCILYEMLTSRPPYVGSAVKVLAQQLYGTPVAPRERKPDQDIPADLEDLVLRMLHKHPAERPTMVEVRDELERIGQGPEEAIRGRSRGLLLDRVSRMVPTPRPPADATTLTDMAAPPRERGDVQLAVVGALGGDLTLGLGANGLIAYIVSEDQPVEGADVIYAPGASLAELEELESHGLPRVTDTDPTDIERVTALLRLGIDEVVHRPVRADDLARKTWRALRRHRRSMRPGP